MDTTQRNDPLAVYKEYKHRFKNRLRNPGSERAARLHLLVISGHEFLVVWAALQLIVHLITGLNSGVAANGSVRGYVYLALTAGQFLVALLGFSAVHLLGQPKIAFYTLIGLILFNAAFLPVALWYQEGVFMEANSLHAYSVFLFTGYNFLILCLLALLHWVLVIVFYATRNEADTIRRYVQEAARIGVALDSNPSLVARRILSIAALLPSMTLVPPTQPHPGPPLLLPAPSGIDLQQLPVELRLTPPQIRTSSTESVRRLEEDVVLLTIREYALLLGLPSAWDILKVTCFFAYGLLTYHICYISAFLVLQCRRSFIIALSGNFPSLLDMESVVMRFAAQEVVQFQRGAVNIAASGSDTEPLGASHSDLARLVRRGPSPDSSRRSFRPGEDAFLPSPESRSRLLLPIRRADSQPRQSIFRAVYHGLSVPSASPQNLGGSCAQLPEGPAHGTVHSDPSVNPYAALMIDSITMALSPGERDSDEESIHQDSGGLGSAVTNFFAVRRRISDDALLSEAGSHVHPHRRPFDLAIGRSPDSLSSQSEIGALHTTHRSSAYQSSGPRTLRTDQMTPSRKFMKTLRDVRVFMANQHNVSSAETPRIDQSSNARGAASDADARTGSLGSHGNGVTGSDLDSRPRSRRMVLKNQISSPNSHYLGLRGRFAALTLKLKQKASRRRKRKVGQASFAESMGQSFASAPRPAGSMHEIIRTRTSRRSPAAQNGHSRSSIQPSSCSARTPETPDTPSGWEGNQSAGSNLYSGRSGRSPDTVLTTGTTTDERSFDDFGSSTSGAEYDADVDDIWMGDQSSSRGRHQCAPWLRNTTLARGVCRFNKALKGFVVTVFNHLHAVCLVREITIFPVSRNTKITIPEQTLLRTFANRDFEEWYTEWLQAFCPKIIHYMSRPLLICTLVQGVHVVADSLIFLPRALPALRTRAANWSPTDELDYENVLRLGAVYVDRSVLEGFNPGVLQHFFNLIVILRCFFHMAFNVLIISSMDFSKRSIYGRKAQLRCLQLILVQYVFAIFDVAFQSAILGPFNNTGFRGPPTTVYAALVCTPIYGSTLRMVPIVFVMSVFWFIVAVTVAANGYLVGMQSTAVLYSLAFVIIALVLVARAFDQKRRHTFARYVLPYLIYLEGLSEWILRTEANQRRAVENGFLIAPSDEDEDGLRRRFQGDRDIDDRNILGHNIMNWSQDGSRSSRISLTHMSSELDVSGRVANLTAHSSSRRRISGAALTLIAQEHIHHGPDALQVVARKTSIEGATLRHVLPRRAKRWSAAEEEQSWDDSPGISLIELEHQTELESEGAENWPEESERVEDLSIPTDEHSDLFRDPSLSSLPLLDVIARSQRSSRLSRPVPRLSVEPPDFAPFNPLIGIEVPYNAPRLHSNSDSELQIHVRRVATPRRRKYHRIKIDLKSP